MRVLLALVFTACAARAEPPPPAYFTGTYERVGRDAAQPPGLVNDVIRLDPVDGGLMLSVCGTGVGDPVPPLLLRFDASGEVQDFLYGKDGPVEVWCLFRNNGDNYPLLTCASDMGARFMLWPEPDLPCPG